MRTNSPDEPERTGGADAAFCAACEAPMKPEAALCTACGTRRDGEAERTRVLAEEPADRDPEPADRGPAAEETPAVRGAGESAGASGAGRRRLGLLIAGVGGFFGVLLLLWGLSGPGGGAGGGAGGGGGLLAGWGGGGVVPARAVRVLPLFGGGAEGTARPGLLLVQRDEPAAEGAGAAVVVELGAVEAGTTPRLFPAGGGDAAAGVRLAPAGDAAEVDLRPLGGSGPSGLLPVRPPDRYFERPSPQTPERLEATAAYEGGGFDGRLRLAAGGGEPVRAEGTVRAESEADPKLAATLAWSGDRLAVQAGPDADLGRAGAASGGAPGGAWLFVLPEGAPPAVGAYEVRGGDRVLARIELPPAPQVVVGGGTRPGKILPSPIKRANGTAPPPPPTGNNPLAYFDVLTGARANARGLTSANAMRQMATGFLLYEQSRGGMPDSLEELSAVLGPMDALLHNQRTGDNPGFLYEKPAGGGGGDPQPMVWETIGGQKDPTGAVLMSDGTIR